MPQYPDITFLSHGAAIRSLDAYEREFDEWAKEYGMSLDAGGTEGFKVNDSGAREQYASGMQRDTTTDKPRYDLIFDGPMMERYAEHLRKGAVKYNPRNWMKANSEEEMERFRESAARHFAQWMAGNVDEDHAAAVMFNLNGYEYVKARLGGRIFKSMR